MDFGQVWQQYGPWAAIIAVLIAPFAGRIWDAALKALYKHQTFRAKQDEAEQRAELKREQTWIVEFKDLLKDYRDQRNLAIKRAERAEEQRDETIRNQQERHDRMMQEYIAIIRAKEKQDAAVIEVIRDTADLNRRLLDRLEDMRREMWPALPEPPTQSE